MTQETDVRLVFDSAGTFEACSAAEAWCAANGYSVGRAQAHSPRGILRGDFDIQKWRNLRRRERDALDGVMTGDMRNGPVFVEIGPRAVARAVTLGAKAA